MVTHRCSCRSKCDCSVCGMWTRLVASMKRIITCLQPRRQPDGRHALVPISESFLKSLISWFEAVQCSARFSHNVLHSYGLQNELLGKSHKAKRTEHFSLHFKSFPRSHQKERRKKRTTKSEKRDPSKMDPSFLCTPTPPSSLWFPACLPLMFLGKDQWVEATGLAGVQSCEGM